MWPPLCVWCPSWGSLGSLSFGLPGGGILAPDLPAMAPFIGIFATVVGVALIVFRTRDRQRHEQV